MSSPHKTAPSCGFCTNKTNCSSIGIEISLSGKNINSILKVKLLGMIGSYHS
jgi:hypothetical protein